MRKFHVYFGAEKGEEKRKVGGIWQDCKKIQKNMCEMAIKSGAYL